MSPGLFHREKFHSEHEFSHYFGSSKAQNSCTEEKPRAQEALDYGPFELSLFAEETILNPRHGHNVHKARAFYPRVLSGVLI